MSNQYKIPFCIPYIGKEETAAVTQVLESKWIGTGAKVKEFEDRIKDYIGCKVVVAVSSCTAALNICLAMQNLQPGDEVITTAYTFPSTIHAIIQQGGTPVFADIEGNSFNIDPFKIDEKITEKTRGIIPVHFAGQSCRMLSIMSIAKLQSPELFIIQDAAHAFGGKHKNVKIGNSNNLVCFSFYPTKTITTGEGGMICTNRVDLEAEIRAYANNGIIKSNPPFYNVVCPGFKANMTDIQAAIGIEQLKKIDIIIDMRNQIASWYDEQLKEIEEITIPFVPSYNSPTYHLYPILIDFKKNVLYNRNRVIESMKNKGIECSWHYMPIFNHKYFYHTLGDFKGKLPLTTDMAIREISLPIYPELTKSDIIYVCDCLKEAIAKVKK